MKYRIIKTALLLMFVASMAIAQTSSPEKVVQMVKDVRLPEDQLKSLAFDLRMNLPMPLNILCQVRFQAPDKYSMFVFDNHDQTPIMIIVGHTAMINDPFASSLTVIASAGVAFDLVPRGAEYNAQFACNMPVDGQINNRIVLDFKTMFSRVTENVKVENASSGSLIFSGTTEQKSRCVAVFAEQKKFALSEVGLFVEGEPTAILELADIRVDGEFAPVADTFPLAQLASSTVPFDIIEPQGVIDTALVAATVLKAVFARSAIRNQSLRENIESMMNQKIDWDSAGSADASRSEKLREIFKPL